MIIDGDSNKPIGYTSLSTVVMIHVFNKDEKIKTLPLFAHEDLKKVNFFKSLITSINYLIWGDV